jgi:Outer membrane protein beta-barrel domain
MNGKLLLCVAVLSAASASAQEWEVGVIGGFGFSPDLTVKGPTGNASTGFQNGAVIGAYGGEDMYRYFSGEARYLYRYSDLKLSSNGTSVDFGAHTHIITGDILAHFRPVESRMRPFVAFGGGIEVIQGTGTESAGQPLGNFAALTHTREILPVADVGVGIKYQWTHWIRLRAEVHDYIGSAPSEVIAPAPGASLNGVRNDILATGSIGFTW